MLQLKKQAKLEKQSKPATTEAEQEVVSKKPVAAWPPPPIPHKRPSFLVSSAKIGAISLALLLLIAGSGLLIFTTTRGYTRSLRHIATVYAQQTSSVVGTEQAQVRGTEQAINRAQSAIEATATAQAAATAQVDEAATMATATQTAAQNLLSQWTEGTPRFDDSLSDDKGTGQWDEGGANSYVGCSFSDGNYNVSENQVGYLQPCIAQNTSFSDFAYQVSMTFKKGNLAQAGLIFRISASNDAYYFLHISTNGSYGLNRYDATGNNTTLRSGTNNAINTGLGASNQLAVIANKDHLTFFANGQYLDVVSDSTLSSGKIGLAVIDTTTPAEVAFSDAQVWLFKQQSQN
jgi:hypothetical protein